MYCSKMSGYNYKLAQIQNYDWLKQSELDKGVERLKKHVSEKGQFEVRYSHTDRAITYDEIVGFVDCIDRNTVWEFKCVQKLQNEHIIQLALYAYLVETKHRKAPPMVSAKHVNMHVARAGKDDRITSLFQKFGLTINDGHDGRDDHDAPLHYNYMLFNVNNNNIWKMTSTYGRLRDMVKYIIQKKFQENITSTDLDFQSECAAIANGCGLAIGNI